MIKTVIYYFYEKVIGQVFVYQLFFHFYERLQFNNKRTAQINHLWFSLRCPLPINHADYLDFN